LAADSPSEDVSPLATDSPSGAEIQSTALGRGRLYEPTDGQLADVGAGFVDDCRRAWAEGASVLAVDLSALSVFTVGEMRLLTELAQAADGRAALILDRSRRPEFWRLLELWSLDGQFTFFADRDQARQELAAAEG
jgi:hypothetical protein